MAQAAKRLPASPAPPFGFCAGGWGGCRRWGGRMKIGGEGGFACGVKGFGGWGGWGGFLRPTHVCARDPDPAS